MEKDKVCVTGANGFIGSCLVRTLLEYGYTDIHCSVQPSTDHSHLLSFLEPYPNARLTIFTADLLDSDAIAKAVQGCSGVFHLASPCFAGVPKDPENEMILPAVQGTINVLEAAKANNAKRVVITCSIATLFPNPSWDNDKVIDETSWTDIPFCESTENWYSVAKTQAEKAAWEFSKQHGLDVVTIHPSIVLGPKLQPGLNASSAFLQEVLQGSKETYPYHWLGHVDVRDIAKAQILLLETPAASGRYLCTDGIYQFREFAERVSKLYPDYPVHRFTEETDSKLRSCNNAAKRFIDLGLVFTPFEDTIHEGVKSLKSNGFLA
ncbi:hypothetical protein ACFE04_000203 [Oxalis oulophora]